MIPTKDSPKGLEGVDDTVARIHSIFVFDSAYVHKGAHLVVLLLEGKIS